jgi:hypothetical protein
MKVLGFASSPLGQKGDLSARMCDVEGVHCSVGDL